MATLLVVDDDKHIRETLGRFFESLTYQVRLADSAAEALRIVSQERIDLVLTDFRMAEMNGLELLKAVKRRRAESLVILMTAYGTVENAVAVMKAGAYDYLTKPFSLEQIQHAVERALQLQDLQAENSALHAVIDDSAMLEFRAAPRCSRYSIPRARLPPAMPRCCSPARAEPGKICSPARFIDGVRGATIRSWW